MTHVLYKLSILGRRNRARLFESGCRAGPGNKRQGVYISSLFHKPSEAVALEHEIKLKLRIQKFKLGAKMKTKHIVAVSYS